MHAKLEHSASAIFIPPIGIYFRVAAMSESSETALQVPAEQRILYTAPALSSAESDSDGGYGTPAESFADDERPLTPPSTHQQLPASTRGDELVVVEPELKERIKAQVEYYFSDDNLGKDAFLMKHIGRNRLGYVSLKLVASLRKVKSLSKDWRVVLASVRSSELLALNEEETKIRRLAPPPQVDYSHVARTLLVTGYPQSEPDPREVEAAFGRHGEVTQVRVLLPGKAVPLDVKPSRAGHPALGTAPCLLVEYASPEGAWSACCRLRGSQGWRDQMKVALLGKEPAVAVPEPEKPHKPTEKRVPRQMNEGAARKGGRQTNRLLPSTTTDANQRWLGSKFTPELPRKCPPQGTVREYASDSGCSSRSPSHSPKASPEPPRRPGLEASWRNHDKRSHIRENSVLRRPLGPDGSRGFHSPGSVVVS